VRIGTSQSAEIGAVAFAHTGHEESHLRGRTAATAAAPSAAATPATLILLRRLAALTAGGLLSGRCLRRGRTRTARWCRLLRLRKSDCRGERSSDHASHDATHVPHSSLLHAHAQNFVP
jgi:hypothetical protein